LKAYYTYFHKYIRVLIINLRIEYELSTRQKFNGSSKTFLLY